MLKWKKTGFRDIVSSRILNDSHPLGSFSETKVELQNKSALSSWGWAEIGGVERLKAEILERGCPSQVVTLWCLLVLCVLGDIKVAQPESVSKRRGRKVMVSDQWFYRTSLSVSIHLWMCFLAESFMPLQSFHSLAAAQFTRQHQLAEITAGTPEDTQQGTRGYLENISCLPASPVLMNTDGQSGTSCEQILLFSINRFKKEIFCPHHDHWKQKSSGCLHPHTVFSFIFSGLSWELHFLRPGKEQN